MSDTKRNPVEQLLPRCDRCGVEYIADYEGPCQERIDWHQETPCGGTVSWKATAAVLWEERNEWAFQAGKLLAEKLGATP